MRVRARQLLNVRRLTSALAIAVVALVLSACSGGTYRFRLVIELEVAGSPVFGEVVQQAELHDAGGTALSNFNRLSLLPRGQALVLDLGSRGVLIAIMRAGTDSSDDYWYLYSKACGLDGSKDESTSSYISRVVAFRGKCPLKIEQVPDLLVAPSIRSPRGMRWLPPAQLGEVLGPDVVFKGAWFESTDDPVTTDIEAVLPWTRADAPENRNGFLSDIDVGFKVYGRDFHNRI